MAAICIDTYCATDPGPRQWVAILQVMEPDKDGKLHTGVCMNFWGPSEIDSCNRAQAWLASEVDRARSREQANLDKQKRLAEYQEAKRR